MCVHTYTYKYTYTNIYKQSIWKSLFRLAMDPPISLSDSLTTKGIEGLCK